MTGPAIDLAVDLGLDVARLLAHRLTWVSAHITPPTCPTSIGGSP